MKSQYDRAFYIISSRIKLSEMWKLFALLVVLAVGVSAQVKRDEIFILYTDAENGTVGTMSLDGKLISHCLPANTFVQPEGITYDSGTNMVYVVDDGKGHIYKFPLDGKSEPKLLASINNHVNLWVMALDGNGHIYFAEAFPPSVMYRMNEDGSDLITLFSTPEWIHGIAVDKTNGFLIWTGFIDNIITRAPLSDPTSQEIIVPVGITVDPHTLYIDDLTNKVYWTEWLSGRVLMANTDGTNVTTLVQITNVNGQVFRDITGYGKHQYVTSRDSTHLLYHIHNDTYTELRTTRAQPIGITIVRSNISSNVCHIECQNKGMFNETSRTCECIDPWSGRECTDSDITITPPPSTTQSTEDTQVFHVWPVYGPQAGGTTLTIQGYNLASRGGVILGDNLTCTTKRANDTVLLAVTPSLLPDNHAILGKPLPIIIVISPKVTLDTSHFFVYKEDPVIDHVFPTETIIPGGTTLTVVGSNLNSVAVITMDTAMVLKELVDTQAVVYNVTITTYTTVCNIVNETQFICMTPVLDLPPGFLIKSRRRRQQYPYHSDVKRKQRSQKVQGHNNNNLQMRNIIQLRTRRDVKIELSNEGDILEFYIGFNLDGVDEYKNYTVIDVFIEPAFILDTGIRDYSEGERLQFQGEHLDVGVTVHDYNITIGKELCVELELLSNMLSCRPPDAEPELEEDNDMEHPRIVINVGLNIQHMAGYLRYSSTTLPLYAIVLAAVIPTCAVIIIVTAVVCVKKRC